jgi:hypothetical protein
MQSMRGKGCETEVQKVDISVAIKQLGLDCQLGFFLRVDETN